MRIKATRKLYKNSEYTYSINLSPEMVKKMKWREGQKLTIIASQKTGKITIKDWEEK
ncbi:MAG: hypothetical protein ABH887_01415 [bacterium]